MTPLFRAPRLRTREAQPLIKTAIITALKQIGIHYLFHFIGVIIGLFILLVIIGSFLPETTTSSQNQKTETSNVPAGEKMFQSNKFSIVLPDSAKISPANGDADSLYASYVLPYGTIYVDIADKGAAILNSGKKSTTYYNVKVTEIPMTISGVQTTVLAVDGRNKLPEKSDVLLINGEYNTQDFESKTTNPYIVNYGVRVMSTTKLSDAQMAEFRNEYDKITKSLIFKN